MAKTEKVLARLKPYNPKRGHVMQRYVAKGARFLAGVWYEVPKSLGDYLAEVTEQDQDPDSPLAFDVGDLEHARDVMRREKEEEERRRRRVTGTKVRQTGKDGVVREINLDEEDEFEEEDEHAAALTTADLEPKKPKAKKKPAPRKKTTKKGGRSSRR